MEPENNLRMHAGLASVYVLHSSADPDTLFPKTETTKCGRAIAHAEIRDTWIGLGCVLGVRCTAGFRDGSGMNHEVS